VLLKFTVFLLFLAGGAIVNIAVAGGCALWNEESETLTVCDVNTGLAQLRDVFKIPEATTYVAHFGVGEGQFVRRAWAVGGTVGSAGVYSVHEVWAGCPFASVRGRRLAVGDGAWVEGGVPLPDEIASAIGAHSGFPIPVRPIWPGFAINSIFYAALLWALWFAPGKIRRMLRIRRDCCPTCSYKIAPGVGEKCSECGAELPERLRKEHN
jgi:hypothetical protein